MPTLTKVLHSNVLKAGLLIVLSVVLISCEAVGYYSQAARGQLAIVMGREDIRRLLQQQDLPVPLTAKLKKVLEIREFAEQELGLPIGEHYTTYVDVKREHVVWNVFAAPEFSLDPVNWCYPIAGCVSYRGYFLEQAALSYGAKLQQDGFDVYSGGIDAYSTLGWFEDSVLSTVLNRADYQLAGLIFHELAHQVVYVAGDTTFNESFATAVEREGVRRWLSQSNTAADIRAATQEHERQQQFVGLVSQYRDRFAELYQQQLAPESMRLKKAALQQALRSEYQTIKQDWQGYTGYDAWFSHSLNNAQIATVASYNDLLPFFMALLHQSNEDFGDFFIEVKRIAQLPSAQREAIIAALQ